MADIVVSRPFFLGVVVVAALAAVLLKEGTTSSFLAGLAVGAGLVFVGSFLRNPRNPRRAAEPAAKSPQDDQNSDR